MLDLNWTLSLPPWPETSQWIGGDNSLRRDMDRAIQVVQNFTAPACAAVSLRVMVTAHMHLFVNGHLVVCTEFESRLEDEQACRELRIWNRVVLNNDVDIDTQVAIPSFMMNSTGTQVCYNFEQN